MKLIKVKPGTNKFRLVVDGKKTRLGELMIYYSPEKKDCQITIRGLDEGLVELSISDGRLRQ